MSRQCWTTATKILTRHTTTGKARLQFCFSVSNSTLDAQNYSSWPNVVFSYKRWTCPVPVMNRLCVRTLSFEYFVEKYTGGKKTEIRNCVMWINAMRTPSGDTGFTLHYQQPDYGRTYSFILFTYLFIIRKAAVDQRHFLKRSALRRGVKCYTFSRRNKNKPDHSQESTEHNSRVEGSKNICRTFMDWMNCQYKNTTTWCRPYFKLSWLRNIADPKFWNGPIRSFHRQLLFSI